MIAFLQTRVDQLAASFAHAQRSIRSWIKGLYAHTDAPEFEQAIIRIAVLAVVLGAFLWYASSDGNVDSREGQVLFAILAVIFLSVLVLVRIRLIGGA